AACNRVQAEVAQAGSPLVEVEVSFARLLMPAAKRMQGSPSILGAAGVLAGLDECVNVLGGAERKLGECGLASFPVKGCGTLSRHNSPFFMCIVGRHGADVC